MAAQAIAEGKNQKLVRKRSHRPISRVVDR